MTTPSMQIKSQAFRLSDFIRNLWQIHAPLTLSGLLTAAVTLFFIAGIFLDERTITGAPAWLKPTKFGISITLYSLTLTWILGFIRTDRVWRRRLVSTLAWTVIVTFALEWFALITQVVRGTTSHFNVATPFDAVLWGLMGTSIVVLWFANFVIAGLLLFQRFDKPAFAWSLRLGLIITIIGMGLGFLMTNPTAQQMAAWNVGTPVTIVGAHSVGVADGGPGLPITGWSTQGGDLRIGHFIGMHALQVIPFLGWLVTRRRKWSVRQQTALIFTAALGYLGLAALLTWQALRAQPITQPDALTVGVFLAIVAATGMVVVGIVRFGRARAPALQPNTNKGTQL